VGRALLNVPSLVLLEHAAEVRPALVLDEGVRALAAVGLDAASLLAALDQAVATARAAEVARALARAAFREAAAHRKTWLGDVATWGKALRAQLGVAEGAAALAAEKVVACLTKNWSHRFEPARRAVGAAAEAIDLYGPATGLDTGAPVARAARDLVARGAVLAEEQDRAADTQRVAVVAAAAAKAELQHRLRAVEGAWSAARAQTRSLPALPSGVLRDYRPRARPDPLQSESEGEHSELEGEHSESEGEHSESEGEHSESEGEHGELVPEHSELVPEHSESEGELLVMVRARASIR
jgi:hypothetical protein